MFSHYLDVMLKLPEAAHGIHARLMTAAHLCCGIEKRTMAVAWPDWQGTPGEFGFLFRIFGSEADISAFQEKIALMVEKNLIRCFPVQPVPETSETVYFVRDRRIDARAPSRLARLIKRAQARGEEFTPKGPAAYIPAPHFLHLNSVSGKRAFKMYIRRKKEGASDKGRAYGLGYPVPHF